MLWVLIRSASAKNKKNIDTFCLKKLPYQELCKYYGGRGMGGGGGGGGGGTPFAKWQQNPSSVSPLSNTAHL